MKKERIDMKHLLLFFIILNVCCAPSPPPELPSITTGVPVTSISNTLSPTGTFTQTSQQIDETTTISLSTPVLTQTSTSVLPPVSTLPPEKSKEYLLQLLNNNGECKLPCFWGMIPGKTETDSLRQFEAKFGDVEQQDFASSFLWNEKSSSLYIQIVENALGTTFFLEHRGTPVIDYLYFHTQRAYELGSNEFLKLGEYELSTILARYGEPTQIMLGPWPIEPARPNQWLPFDLVLFYQDQGFLIEYVLDRQVDANFFIGCPQRVVGLNVVTWDPNITRSIDDVVRQKTDLWGVSRNNLRSYFLTIRDAMGLTVQDFYEDYKTQQDMVCLKAPRIKWPYGDMKTATP